MSVKINVSNSDKILGRITAGSGEVEELDVAERTFTTGDIKITIKTTADPGWVMLNDGTIGNASSGATTRANADTEDLFTLLWTNTADAQCAVSGGRGASASADFSANKNIALPKILGRALASSGGGAGLTSRVVAETAGAETHQLTQGELPNVNFVISGTFYQSPSSVNGSVVGGGTGPSTVSTSSISAASGGSDSPHNNMQPTAFLPAMIKL